MISVFSEKCNFFSERYWCLVFWVFFLRDLMTLFYMTETQKVI